MPKDYIRRQTVKNAERFITPELKSFEDKVLGAREKALAREREIYEAVLTQLTDRLAALQATAGALAALDCAERAGRTRRAARLDRTASSWPRPASRFAAAAIRWSSISSTARSCPTTCVLDASRRMLIVTGPNMGGKSHLHAPGRADRAARARRQLRARRARRARARSIASSRASARATISPAAAPRSWWR